MIQKIFPTSLKSFSPEYISKVIDVESDRHSGFQVVSYFLGSGQRYHLALQNQLNEDTQEIVKRIKDDSSGPCGTSNWMTMPTAGDLIANMFKAPVFF
ncbi:hypothetical protein VP01_847g4, partial [Puccinia sorghi]